MYYLQHTNVNNQINQKNWSKKVYFLIFEENKKYFQIFTSVWHSLWSILCMYTKTMKFGQQEVKLWRLKDLRFNVEHFVCARYENKHSVNHMCAIIVRDDSIRLRHQGGSFRYDCVYGARRPRCRTDADCSLQVTTAFASIVCRNDRAVSGLRGHSSQPPPPPPPVADFGITRPGPLAAS